MKECKHCNHNIVKRKGEWKHYNGGNYCKSKDYSKHYYGKTCYCHKAELKRED